MNSKQLKRLKKETLFNLTKRHELSADLDYLFCKIFELIGIVEKQSNALEFYSLENMNQYPHAAIKKYKILCHNEHINMIAQEALKWRGE